MYYTVYAHINAQKGAKMNEKKGGAGNLIPINKRTKEQQKEITRKGGIKSGETRRRQKTIKGILNLIDKQHLPKKESLTIERFFQIEDPTFREAIFLTLYKEALLGNLRAIELYLKLKGEMPKDITLQANDKSLTIIWNEKRYDTDTETE